MGQIQFSDMENRLYELNELEFKDAGMKINSNYLDILEYLV